MLRVALALPFVTVALLSRSSPWVAQANVQLIARGELVRWGDTHLGWTAEIFPPIAAAISSVLGGSELAMNLLAAAVIGFTLQRLAGVLVRRGFGLWPTSAVIGTLLLTTPLYYLAANDLQALLGIALLVIALDGIASFVEDRSTEAGFRAGLALGVAVMVDPGSWLYALTLAAVAPFFARHAGRSGRGANPATIAVLLFPAAAAVAFWLYVSWWFSSDPLGGMENATWDGWFVGGVSASAVTAARSIGLGFLSVPLFWVAAGFRARRDPWSLIAPGIAVVGLFLSLWFGLRESSGQTYVVLTTLYVLLLATRHPSRRRRVIIIVAGLLQTAVSWALVLSTGSVLGQWVRAVTSVW
ncbi:MAG TPA: hypothetical protein VGC67_01675 [Cellulomonas sp.]